MAIPSQRADCIRGPLISIDGVTGVGKTYLTDRAVELLDDKPFKLDGFSQRGDGRPGLAEALLAALKAASAGDPFLRGGAPAAETLILLAIKRKDLEAVLPVLSAGRTVIEGRSIDSTAVCQALLLRPGDPGGALETATALLDLAAAYRPLPDLTILIADDAAAAIGRAQRRDRCVYTSEQATFMHQACLLFERLAATDPARFTVVDRRTASEDEAAEQIRALIRQAETATRGCVSEPWADPTARCMYCGQHTEPASA